MRTAPRGSFRMRGPKSLFWNEISEGFSSFANRAVFFCMNMMSFKHQFNSARNVSYRDLPMSFLHAAMIASLLSSSLFYYELTPATFAASITHPQYSLRS